jgi:hypothetical protein
MCVPSPAAEQDPEHPTSSAHHVSGTCNFACAFLFGSAEGCVIAFACELNKAALPATACCSHRETGAVELFIEIPFLIIGDAPFV